MNPITSWTLGWRSLWRDLRSGELRLLMVAVTLAVAALTSVGFFSDRLQGGLQRDARQLLGGDVVVVSDNPPAAAWTEQARALKLLQALTLSFPTMGRAPDAQAGATRLVALKAVPAGYPLRGQLTVAPRAGDPGGPTRDVPARGEYRRLWLVRRAVDRPEDVAASDWFRTLDPTLAWQHPSGLLLRFDLPQ